MCIRDRYMGDRLQNGSHRPKSKSLLAGYEQGSGQVHVFEDAIMCAKCKLRSAEKTKFERGGQLCAQCKCEAIGIRCDADSEREKRSTCASEYDYMHPDDDEPAEILIGEDFQAEIPPFDPTNKCSKFSALVSHLRCDPSKVNAQSNAVSGVLQQSCQLICQGKKTWSRMRTQ
eukprot:TRINITY_DN7080_c0_g1_i1.p1 TRINITY_DN7080_c0_g1~~TRINITY_DN7080_c0_g1_i1.p1  ORF type:complete len:193 (+),score=21.73 TRINITY_DN7080_c0_g1_i1:61-579(+)